MGDTSRLLASQGKECVSNATNLDTREGIALRGRDPKVMGHHSPIHQWGMHRRLLFLPTSPWARKDNISPRVLHKHLLFRKRTTWAGAWVKVEDKAHRPGLQGPKGVSTPSHLRLSLQIIWSFKVHFYSFASGQEYCLILVHLIHSLPHHV